MQHTYQKNPLVRQRPGLSIPFVGFLRMQPAAWCWDYPAKVYSHLSQFPLWDFFECNLLTAYPGTGGSSPYSQFPLWDFFECNREVDGLSVISSGPYSQFPLWDFFECNIGGILFLRMKYDDLSIPFVGFLRMQPRNSSRSVAPSTTISLNSLCGISSNATKKGVTLEELKAFISSQFPLWDFFECNKSYGAALGLDPLRCPLNSLCGISSNATLQLSLNHSTKAS